MSIARYQLVNADYFSPAKYGGKMRISKMKTDSAEILKLTAKSFICPDVNVTRGLWVMSEGNGVINVKAYGAVGDGIADDTTAIQNALNYGKTHGGCVYFPAGIYGVNADLDATNTVSYSIQGDGWNSIIRNLGRSNRMLCFRKACGVVVKDICIDSNGRVHPDSECVALFSSRYITLDRVRVCNCTQESVFCVDDDYIARGTNTDNWFKNCLFEDSSFGLFTRDMLGCGVVNCVFLRITKQGILVNGISKKCSINGCVLIDCGTGIEVTASQAAIPGTPQQVVVSNCFMRCNSYGIIVYNSVNCVFSNIIIDMKEQGNEPIRIGSANSSALASTGNVMKNITIKNIASARYPLYMWGYTSSNLIEIDALSDMDHTHVVNYNGTNNSYNVVDVSSQRNLYSVATLSTYQVGTGTECELMIKGSTSLPKTANVWQGNTIEATSTTTLELLPCFEHIQTTGVNVPVLGPVTLPTAGAIGGLFSYLFPSNALKEVYMPGIQMPNEWREGSLIYPRAYFLLTDIPTTLTTNIRLKLEYNITDVGEKIPTTATTLTLDLALASLGISQEGYLLVANLKSTGITMTGFTKACVINCRLYREVLSGSFYAGDMYLMGFGFLYNKRFIPGQ